MVGIEIEPNDRSETMSVLDPRSQRVVDELHAMANAQRSKLLRRYLPKLPALITGRPIDFSRNMEFYDDKLLPLDPAQGELLYMLARARMARRVVEFGTSFGVSTIYLASAMRDGRTGGRVIGTEVVANKVAAASRNIADAGLSEHVEILAGDARVTLQDLPGEVDMLLLDGWPSIAMDILDIMEPKLLDDAIIVVDNVGHFRGNLRSLVERLAKSPRYRSCRLPLNSGTVVAMFRGD